MSVQDDVLSPGFELKLRLEGLRFGMYGVYGLGLRVEGLGRMAWLGEG